MEEDVRSKKNKVTDHNNHYLKSDSEKESNATISKRVIEFKYLTKKGYISSDMPQVRA